MEAAELRQAAVPGRLPSRSDPSAAEAASGPDRTGGALPGRSSGGSRVGGRPARDRARGEDPRQRGGRPEADRRARDQGTAGIWRPRAVAGVLQQGVRDRRQLSLFDLHAAQRAPVDRCGGASADVRERGAAAEVAAAGRQGPRQRVPAHRAGRRLRSGAHGLDRDAGRVGAGRRRHHRDAGRGWLPDHRPQAVGHQRNGRGHRRGDGEGAQGRRSPRRDQRFRRCRTTARGSRSCTATRSWACAGSRTP